jgi:hypothetical protein
MQQAPRLRAFLLLGILLLGPTAPLRAEDEPDPDEPPAAGRPDDFSQVVGAYSISARAAPTELRAEDPLLLIVAISGSGPPAYQPRREHLRLFPPALQRDFFVKPLLAKDRYREQARTWEFAYELRPKRVGVAKVPALRLVYYDPVYKKYQTSYSPALPLAVRERPQAAPPADLVHILEPPAVLYDLATGPDLLRREGRVWPGLPGLFALLLTPPAACALWYVLWRRRHPVDAQLAHRRRTRAAEQTLKALHGATAVQVADLLAGYLRQRLDLAVAAPTPREAARLLRRLGASRALTRQAADVLRACDAARFAPAPSAGGDSLPGQAAQLILALEAEPCHPC